MISYPCLGRIGGPLVIPALLLNSMDGRDKPCPGRRPAQRLSIPSGPRTMAAMPVRATSTRPTGSISATNCSILSLLPVISNTKLCGGVDHAGAEGIRQPQRLDPVVALAAH